MQRLKTRPQFQAVLAGALIAKTTHFALHRLDLDTDAATLVAPPFPVTGPWIGAMAPKRWAKRAVTRNAIKRQIYTVCASLIPPLSQAAFLVRLRREFSRQEFVSASSVLLKDAARTELLALMQAGLEPR
jgi:ribonuclease P protein component